MASTSLYPNALDSFPDPGTNTSQDDPVLGLAPRITALNDAMEAVQGILGTNPQGSAATVAARLAGLGSGGSSGTTWVYRGTWTTGTAYAVNDTVVSGGSSFIVLTAHTAGATAPTPTTPGANYGLLAAAGADGASGAPGPAGADGTNGTGITPILAGQALPAGLAAGQIIATYSQEQIAAGVASTDTFTLTAHGLGEGQPIALTAAGPAATPALTQGIVGTTPPAIFYYAKNVTANTFQLTATSPSGTLINLTSDGNLRFVQ